MKVIQLNISGFRPFASGPYEYILAGNGLFLAKENDVYRAIVRMAPEELGLLPLEERLEIKRIRIPFLLVHNAVEFFREVWHRHGTEAFLWILMQPHTGVISLACPQQTNSPAHVHAEPDEEISDEPLKIGDMHSHPAGCGAFHSSGDMDDEKHRDGLHVVVGDLDAPLPQFAASLVVRGRRKQLEPNDVLELGFGFDPSWLKKVNAGETGLVVRSGRRAR